MDRFPAGFYNASWFASGSNTGEIQILIHNHSIKPGMHSKILLVTIQVHQKINTSVLNKLKNKFKKHLINNY